MSDEEIEEALLIRVRAETANPNIRKARDVVVRRGPKAWKVASLLDFGPPGTEEVSKRTLTCRTFQRKTIPEAGYDFGQPTQSWFCDDEEIDRLQAFLDAELGPPGDYALVDRASQAGALVDAIGAGRVDPEGLLDVLGALLDNAAILDALKGSSVASLLASAVEVHRHREVIDELAELIVTEGTTEPDLQRLLEREWWLFGGRYVKRLDRRQFSALDQLDFALIRADGGAHIIELKRADVDKVVVRHRNHLAVGPEVNLAVNQAMNYLTEFDRQEDYLTRTFGIDCRRVHATVVIGHPDHNSIEGISSDAFHQTIRTYNSHLARVEVVSYADLIAAARNDVESLAARVEGAEASDEPPPPDEPPSEGWDQPPPWEAPAADDVPF